MADLGFGMWIMAAFFGYAIPLVFIAVSVLILWKTRRFTAGARHHTGRVVSVGQAFSNSRNGGGRVYQPTFAYPGPDGPRTATPRGASSGWNFPIGSEVEILVHPDRPDLARVKGGWPGLLGAVFLIVGLVFLAAGHLALSSL